MVKKIIRTSSEKGSLVKEEAEVGGIEKILMEMIIIVYFCTVRHFAIWARYP